MKTETMPNIEAPINITLTAEELELKKNIRHFAEKEIRPFAEKWDDEETFPREVYSKLGELGYLGAIIDEEYGGLGLNLMAGLIIMEEIARCDGGTALSYGAHSFICTYNIAEMASHEQKLKYLPDLCSGKKIGSFCLTEPGSGSDSMAMKTTAKKHGDHYILNGSKTFITNAPDADTYLVFARTGEEGKKGISAFIVEREWEGVEPGNKMKKMGMRPSSTSELYFDNVKVPAENLVGAENGGVYLAMQGLDMERTLFAGLPVGLMQNAYEIAMKYSLERTQFKQPIANFQMIQDMVAQMGMKIYMARMSAYTACRKLEQGQRCTLEASYCKLYAADVANEVTSMAVQILGGYGYIREFEVERTMRDAKLIEIGGGTSQIQKLIIAKELYKQFQEQAGL